MRAMCVAWAWTILAAGVYADAERAGNARVQLKHDKEKNQLQVLIDGREAFVYCHGPELDLPHFYPFRSPGGQLLTIQYPTKFPHHRSFWFADQVRLPGQRAVNLYTAFFSSAGGRDAPKPPFKDHIRHLQLVPGESTKDQTQFQAKLVWEMDHNKPILDESRKIRVVALADGEYFLDITFTVTASHGDVTFVSDAVHYAWPYIRMHPQFSVEGGGTITSSEGGINQQGTNGQVARWIDYSNTVEGKIGGLAVFSHPENGHPHRWLTRDYGTFGPRRVDARSGKPFALKSGDSLSSRVGVLVHRGDVKTGNVASRYQHYVAGKL